MMLYLLKSSAVFLVVIIFYKLFLENEKSFVFNRVYLWTGLIFSIISPMIIYEVPVEWTGIVEPDNVGNWTKYPETLIQDSTFITREQGIDWLALFTYCYVFLSGILLIKFVINLAKMIGKCFASTYQRQGKYRIVVLGKNQVPHSFFNYIFLPKGFDKAILTHEKRHASAYHSLDVLLLEAFQVVFWAHPLFYWFKKLVLLNHEFYADQQSEASDAKKYQKLIFSHIAKNKVNSLASGFNYSFIKKRMIMLQKSTSGPLLWAKKLLVLPLFAMLLIAACEKVEAQEGPIQKDQVTVRLVKGNLAIELDGDTNDVTAILAENNKEISRAELKQFIKNEGLVGYDKVNFKSGGKLYEGREISSIVYTEEKEELFMRKLSEGNGILKISTKANPNGQKYRAIKLGQNQNWGANYTGNEVPPPPPPPALKEPKAPKAPKSPKEPKAPKAPKEPKAPKAKEGIPPPPPPPAPVSAQSGAIPPPPPPAPTLPPPPPPFTKADLEGQISYLSTRIAKIQENGNKEQQEELKELQTTLKLFQEALAKMH
jgi:hypothetical protein